MGFAIRFICVTLFALLSVAIGKSELSKRSKHKPYYDLQDAPVLFEKFIKDYNRTYKDVADKRMHYEAFVENLKKINEQNANPHDHATYGINKFADFTKEEWDNMNGYKLKPIV